MTLGQIATDRKKTVVVVPIGDGKNLSLEDEEWLTLGAFPDVIIEIDSERALPLEAYLVNADQRHLLICPKHGHTIKTADGKPCEYENGQRKLSIQPTNLYADS
ncbi:MAG: hypothetical protein A3J93_01660 [Candidatus Magasanikbacteria bacterium RIFOXYC2_FULL_42_28]|uniref:Uncharacterized protein n=1 Tax=Candidatus Magasanikbacteria bacterium RIFOXYC2_FULL_42_28 TaxID=1798704 RepID=A0A1F6NY24_9BACT|nr:MAG: hypothetical protein A3J93_01660 [Candidatus Magasanikbacteria bacterium RIFOXYC2_FULL_42_28]